MCLVLYFTVRKQRDNIWTITHGKEVYEMYFWTPPSFISVLESIWDIGKAFSFFRQQANASRLTLKDLALKPAFLLALLSGQRCQTIHFLSIDNTLTDEQCTFRIVDKVKLTRVGTHVRPLVFMRYTPDVQLCPVSHLREYIERTTPFVMMQNSYLLASSNIQPSHQRHNF